MFSLNNVFIAQMYTIGPSTGGTTIMHTNNNTVTVLIGNLVMYHPMLQYYASAKRQLTWWSERCHERTSR
jgi:hypothetical protein